MKTWFNCEGMHSIDQRQPQERRLVPLRVKVPGRDDAELAAPDGKSAERGDGPGQTEQADDECLAQPEDAGEQFLIPIHNSTFRAKSLASAVGGPDYSKKWPVERP